MASPLAVGLISWWPFDESGGTRDDVVGGYHLAETGTVPTGVGHLYPLAANFDGSLLNYLSRPTTPPLDLALDFTVLAWVNLPAIVNPLAMLAQWNGSAPTSSFLFAYLHTTFRFAFAWTEDGVNLKTLQANAFGVPPINQWHMVCVRRSIATNLIEISVNDGPKNSLATFGPVLPSALDITSGIRQVAPPSIPGTGRVGPVAVWNRSISDAEWTQLYAGGVGLAYPF
jgi:hypothetical protein